MNAERRRETRDGVAGVRGFLSYGLGVMSRSVVSKVLSFAPALPGAAREAARSKAARISNQTSSAAVRGVAVTVDNILDFFPPVLKDFAFAKRLDDDHLVKLLAAAAHDVYIDGYGDEAERLSFGCLQTVSVHGGTPGNRVELAFFVIYRINTKCQHNGKRIMAIVGTKDKGQVWQCGCIPFERGDIMAAVEYVVQGVKQFKPDFVCGHSLGGFLAESVASHTGISGASFGNPGANFTAFLGPKVVEVMNLPT